jgi:ABC-type transport system involved in cytochrome c biogenesis permease component
MRHNFFAQYRKLFWQGLRIDFNDKERVLSPFLFATSLLILFAFATGELPTESKFKIFAAEIMLIILFTLQGVYLRLFTPEEENGALTLLETYPVSFKALFLAKFSLCILLGTIITLPTLFLTCLFHQVNVATWSLYGVSFLVIFALSALGVLLSALTRRASGRESLFPIIYFLLSSPVLLAAAQGLIHLLQGGEEPQPWLMLLGSCCVIYLTLGVTLFEEVFAVSSSSETKEEKQ